MKYSISNISWQNNRIDEIGPLIKKVGIDGIEIAPNIVWPKFPRVQDDEVSEFKNELAKQELAVSGLQSLLFGENKLQILEKTTQPEIRLRLESAARVANKLGTNILVFGSPKNRLKKDLSTEEAYGCAFDFFSTLIETLEKENVILALEPNAPQYGGDFLTTYEQVIKLVNMINSPWIQPQIDTGCIRMVNKDPKEALQISPPKHVHISNPYLANLANGNKDLDFIYALKEQNYKGWVTFEMLTSHEYRIQEIMKALDWVDMIIGRAK